MPKGWLALTFLACATACSPAKEYQEAARSLRFHLDRVEPSLKLDFPPDRSRVVFRVVLGVDNPSSVPFHVKTFTGNLKLDTGGPALPVGRLDLAKALELPASGTAQMETEVSFGFQDLREAWPLIQSVAKGGPGTWSLEGTLGVVAYGIPLNLPVRSRRATGSAQ